MEPARGNVAPAPTHTHITFISSKARPGTRRGGNFAKISVFTGSYAMSDSFDDRRRGFESKWARDAELRFKVEARRDRLVGVWAAAEKGLAGAAADAFVSAVIAADMEEKGDEDVFRKLRAELDPGKYPDEVIRAKMAESLEQAAAELLG
jgi:hypothetical protein